MSRYGEKEIKPLGVIRILAYEQSTPDPDRKRRKNVAKFGALYQVRDNYVDSLKLDILEYDQNATLRNKLFIEILNYLNISALNETNIANLARVEEDDYTSCIVNLRKSLLPVR